MAYLVDQGMGCFLCPPNYPTYYWEVRDKCGSYSLEHVLENSKYFDSEIVSLVTEKMNKWFKLPLTDPQVKKWINEVMFHFKGCYQNPNNKSWNASELLIDNEIDLIANQDSHAGIHLIRKYYPEFIYE